MATTTQDTDDRTAVQKVFDTAELREPILLELDHCSLKATRCVSKDFEATYQASKKLKTILFRSDKPVLSMLDPANVPGTASLAKHFGIQGGVNPGFCDIKSARIGPLTKFPQIFEAGISIPGSHALVRPPFEVCSKVRIEPTANDTSVTIEAFAYESNALCLDKSQAWRENVRIDTTASLFDEHLVYPLPDIIHLRARLYIRQPSVNVFSCGNMDDEETYAGSMSSVVRAEGCSVGDLLAISSAIYAMSMEKWPEPERVVTDWPGTRDLFVEHGPPAEKASLIASVLSYSTALFMDSQGSSARLTKGWAGLVRIIEDVQRRSKTQSD